jgi:hypothetical protein
VTNPTMAKAMCCADGPGAVKDGRETWTKGPRGRVTSHGGWHLGHRQVRENMGVTVLIESRRRTCKSSEAQEDLACQPIEDDGDTRRGGGRVWSTLLADGLMVSASKPSKAGLRVWSSKPGWRFRGGTDGT